MNQKDPKTAVFIQARYSSTRFRGKLFLDLGGRSILQHIIERVRLLGKTADYTSVLVPRNEVETIRDHLKKYPQVIIFGGEPDNVLKRFYDANVKMQANIIIRLTADNPLVDIFHLNKALKKHKKNKNDYTVYDDLPLGCGFEIISHQALLKCYQKAEKSYQFEHVTPYIREHKGQFRIMRLRPYPFYRHPEYRLTIDEEPDYQLMKIIFKELFTGKPIKVRNVIKYLNNNPQIVEINKHITQVQVP
ncbi:MAG: hypothetical protein JW827_12780 [Spirochaetes bacterium]|nr:hypothetical protein [Spirochaetota bacterium]